MERFRYQFILALLWGAGILTAQDATWQRFSFTGEPWEKYPRGSAVSASLQALSQNPLGVGYPMAIQSRRQALENLDDEGLLGALRKDVNAILQADPKNVAAAFIRSELDEFERDDVFHTPAVGIGYPAWLKLERKGNEVIASTSKDGKEWIELTKLEIHFGDRELFAGVFVQSGDKSKSCTAQVDSVELQFPSMAEGDWKSIAMGEMVGPAGFKEEKGKWSASAFSGTHNLDGGYLYKTVKGDGAIVARIAALEKVGETARAGLLFTDSPDSRDLSALLSIRANGDASVRAEGVTVSSVASLEHLKTLVPSSGAVGTRLARALYYSRRYDEAVSTVMPLLMADFGPVFTIDFDAMMKLFDQEGQLEKVTDAMLKWENKSALNAISITRSAPILVVAQRLRNRGEQDRAIRLLEHGLDQLEYEDDLYLLPYYLQLLDEAGRLKEGEARLLSSLLEMNANRQGARRTGYVLSMPMVEAESREERPRLFIILRYAKKMGALTKLIEGKTDLDRYSTTDAIIIGAAVAILKEEKLLSVLESLDRRVRAQTLLPEEAQLISSLGEMLYSSWPKAKDVALKFLKVAPISAGEAGYEQQIKVLHRLADASRLEGDVETLREAAENAAAIRSSARDNGYGNTYVKQVPPIEFKTAQLLKLAESSVNPRGLIEPYLDMTNVPGAERTLTLARANQVLTRLSGVPADPETVAFPIVVAGESKLGIEMAPGPLHGAHNSSLRVGQPVKMKEFDKLYDWKIWSGPSPTKLEIAKTIESAPPFLALGWPAGLTYVRVDFRDRAFKEPFRTTDRVYAIGIGKNLSPNPLLTAIADNSAIGKSQVEGWSELPHGMFAAGDIGPIPDTPTLRFIPRHSEDTVHLEMNRIPVTPGKRYYQSIWLRSPPRPGIANLGMRFLNVKGERLGISRCPEDYDDPRWLLTSQVLTTREPQCSLETRIPEGTAFLQPVLSIWFEADWCGHFVCETE